MSERHFAILRRHMVEKIALHADLLGDELDKGIIDDRVVAAMLKVPRHLFVPVALAHVAYEDAPLSIGFNKTISQPFITALMTDLLSPEPHETVLEIGTGLGYHAALLAELSGHVCSVEVVEEFVAEAESRLQQLGYLSVEIRVGDGSRGWVDRAPFDKIMVTAATNQPPPMLLQQLKVGGRMVLPMGDDEQHLTVIDKEADGRIQVSESLSVKFSRLETVM
jgi:protein-L-isoaspartate(D-aspartate) O-methyltransferase